MRHMPACLYVVCRRAKCNIDIDIDIDIGWVGRSAGRRFGRSASRQVAVGPRTLYILVLDVWMYWCLVYWMYKGGL
jgi:hypothetical protein